MASRTVLLQSTQWRTCTSGRSHAVFSASSVRYGSWYAPWSWGKSSTPSPNNIDPTAAPSAGVEQVPIASISNQPIPAHAQHTSGAAVTSSTPELAPAGIDKAAVIDHTGKSTATAAHNVNSTTDPDTFDELLRVGLDEVPKREFDPTALIDHAGQLKELGLDYGWGMTALYERMLEQIYLQTGWGWAGSIVTAGIIVRMFTFYFQCRNSDQMAVMSSLAPVTKPIQDKMHDAIARGDKQQAELYRLQYQAALKPYAGGMMSTFGFVAVQAWVGFSAFRCLRAMAELPVPGMTQDGFLWFTDLSQRDPYFILPMTTTAIMYAVFKTGGETGVAMDPSRQKLMTAFAFVIGIITAWQAAVLQLYFLVAGILGAFTGYLLRQNRFRTAIGIRPVPSPQSNEMYTKVVKGELTLNEIKTPDGKIRYQMPNQVVKPNTRRAATTLSGVKIKPGAPIPAHLRMPVPKTNSGRPDREADFEEGAAGKPLSEKLDYYRRNYRASFIWRRFVNSMDDMAKKAGYSGSQGNAETERRRRQAEAREVERSRRFQNKRINKRS